MALQESFGGDTVRLTIAADVAVIAIANPPVNAVSHDVRQGLLGALDAIAARSGLCGAVIVGAGKTFVAGSDIREFGAPLLDPQLPAVIAAIEALPIPVVAAINGPALGGGFELALGCDARIGSTEAVVGLPEVQLGMVPGAGGTQRLPRLVGTATSIELICSGRRVGAQEASALAILDAVFGEDELLEASKDFVRGMTYAKRPLSGPVRPMSEVAKVDAAAQAALKAGRGRPAVAEAIRLVRLVDEQPFKVALAEERRVFQAIRVSAEAAALRYLFFAERLAGKADGLAGASAAPVASTGVVGAGTMGAAVAYVFLRAGLPVVLVERDAASLERGRVRVEQLIDRDLAAEKIDAAQARRWRAALNPQSELAALADCDLVIEAVFEDMAVKSELLASLNLIVGPDTILASNTSYLNIDVLAEASGRPHRFVGLHFFSPAHVMKLLEVVRGEKTAGDVLATVLKLARLLGKTTIIAGVGEGFVGNRIYAAYRRHAEFLIEDGALPWQVDAALEAFGFAMGPFAVSDLSGLDIAWRTRKRLAANRDPHERYFAGADLLCEGGRLGRKTGAGYYNYASGRRMPDQVVEKLLHDMADASGRARREITDKEICRRTLAALVNEAACVMQDGIARRASDIDVALVHGYGFPRWRGGAVYWAATQDRSDILASIDEIAAVQGKGFRRGAVAEMLDRAKTEP